MFTSGASSNGQWRTVCPICIVPIRHRQQFPPSIQTPAGEHSMNDEKYRTLPRRIGASLIDLWPLIPFFVAANIWADLPVDHIGSLLLNFGLYFVGTGYFVVMHARTGQTVGKRMCGVRVVTVRDEQQISWRQSFLREAPLLIFLTVFACFDVTIFALGDTQTPMTITIGYLIAERLQHLWNFGDVVCTLCNFKRRSFHDLIGQTVVIRTG